MSFALERRDVGHCVMLLPVFQHTVPSKLANISNASLLAAQQVNEQSNKNAFSRCSMTVGTIVERWPEVVLAADVQQLIMWLQFFAKCFVNVFRLLTSCSRSLKNCVSRSRRTLRDLQQGGSTERKWRQRLIPQFQLCVLSSWNFWVFFIGIWNSLGSVLWSKFVWSWKKLKRYGKNVSRHDCIRSAAASKRHDAQLCNLIHPHRNEKRSVVRGLHCNESPRSRSRPTWERMQEFRPQHNCCRWRRQSL